MRASIAVGIIVLLGCTGLVGPPPMGDTVMVMYAARDLPTGTRIEEHDLIAIEIEVGYLPEGIFIHPDHVVGQFTRVPIIANDPIHRTLLANPETGHGFTSILPRGQRLVDLPAGDLTSRPGDYVDVWWTPPDSTPCAVVQAAFVLGWDGARRPAEKTSVQRVQLMADPELAMELLVAARSPTLRYVGRNQEDMTIDKEALCSR